MILGQEAENLRLISGEDLFFFRDHYDFDQKVGNLRPISDFFFLVFLEITMILLEKVGNLILILGENFFFRDHYDFEAKSGVFCLFGPPIFSMGQNGPRLKKVDTPGLNHR